MVSLVTEVPLTESPTAADDHTAGLREMPEEITRLRWVNRTFASAAFAEMWLVWITLGWGLQMLIVRQIPNERAIEQTVHDLNISIPFMGGVLCFIAALQFTALFLWNTRLRVHALIAELIFFLAVWLALLRAHTMIPAVFILPTYIATCIIRFCQILTKRD